MTGPVVFREVAGGLARGDADMTLVEASAGTGKTRALTGIVAELVAKEGRRLDEILVVTFTRAATAELRERIRDTLRAAREAAENGPAAAGSQAEELLAGWSRDAQFDRSAAARRLEAALEEIDRANVHTIHGFCQRVLADLAFDGGFPFGFEVSGDDTELVAEAARDFWRRRMFPASRTLARFAYANGFRPESLAGWVRQWRAKPDLRIVGGEPPAVPIEDAEAAWKGVLAEVRTAWEEHRETFLRDVLDGAWLHRGRYRAPRTRSELDAIEALLAAPEPDLPEPGRLERYGEAALAAACKRGHDLPHNPMFEALDQLEGAAAELRSTFAAWLRWARREVLAEARDAIRHRVREDRRLGYDDLLLVVREALQGEDGERFAERIRHEYPIALIDEFQDTDPVQADMFTRIYGRGRSDVAAGEDVPAAPDGPAGGASPAGAVRGEGASPASSPDAGPGRRPRGAGAGAPGGGICVVGDPKQSIYRFRGADVFAYLKAGRTAGSRHSLTRNWRSLPALVEAANAVFAGTDPFVVPEIPYPTATSGREARDPLRIEDGEEGHPLRFRLLPARQDGKSWAKGDAAPVAANAVAEEIARMLSLAADGRAVVAEPPAGGGDARELTGADIAVLVRTRDQGRLVTDALRERNVSSVEIGDESVFDSREAEQVERLLWALAEPGREARERGALAGDLFGLDAGSLRALREDEEAWTGWSERLRGWRAEWEVRGIGPLLRRLVEAEGGGARLLRYRNGARRLTNVRHLTELLQTAEADQRLAPSALAVWFSRRRADERVRGDETQLRIESDEKLVRVTTVHSAKGLEFPVVFLPFAWDGRDSTRGRADHAAYHGAEADGYPAVLDLEPDDAAKRAARREELSEELRLLYVALTRAKYRCTVTWGRVRNAERAPLAWLLHRGEAGVGVPCAASPGAPEEGGEATEGEGEAVSPIDAAESRFLALDAAALKREVEALAGRRPDDVSVSALEPDAAGRRTVLAAPPSPPLAARRFDRPLRLTRQLTSFTSLADSNGVAGAPVAGLPDVDRPDHDQHESAPPAVAMALPDAEEAPARNAFTFPRGAAAGSCLHRIFERLDETPGAETDLDEVCREALSRFGFDAGWREVARSMVERARAVRLVEPTAETPGPPAPSKGSGAPNGFRLADPVPRLVELEFAFPVSGLDRPRLVALLAEHGYPLAFPGGDTGGPVAVDGYLRGFIDLVVEAGGRWYVIDYKSNWLGASPDAYTPSAVAAAMRASAYSLQYLLYLVALHRYLGLRLPRYDYERHAGGVFYLFVRGMDPSTGMERGIWFDRPGIALVERLDRLFEGDIRGDARVDLQDDVK